ncbi:alpha/beta-hydrolase [Choiromyces venosus 120613-1]|uniref:Alpha/beta-hydrolase n=1 Tax=Choiromyces venosus 120613-1 TaxID=1336337 RepID=A0A3N4JC55_9PEZI|nr:alpha/beta-hydrolase [Choiromyces venosus 120613-1]
MFRNVLFKLSLVSAFLLSAAASPLLFPVREQIQLSNRRNSSTTTPISQKLFDEFEELSRIVDIAYCVGSLNTGVEQPFQCLSYCKDFPTFELKQTWNTGIALQDSCGYVALSHAPAVPRIIVAFRGTYSIANAIADLSLTKQEYVPYPSRGRQEKCEGCSVHSGFYESWTQSEAIIGDIVDELVRENPDYKLILVGHSLGGAVAALAGLDFKGRGYEPTVTTFGEPKVGNSALAGFFNRKFTANTYRRVTHIHDPVPLVPLTQWNYSQHAYEYYISASQLPYTREDIHLCEGNEDINCIAGDSPNALQLFWAHRDYFHRLGLCLPEDSFLRKIRLWDSVAEGEL